MTNVPRGFDFSFLNDDEARKILQVLERNEELQRAEKDRIRYKADAFSISLDLRPAAARAWGREARSFPGTPVWGPQTRSIPRAHRPGQICSEVFP